MKKSFHVRLKVIASPLDSHLNSVLRIKTPLIQGLLQKKQLFTMTIDLRQLFHVGFQWASIQLSHRPEKNCDSGVDTVRVAVNIDWDFSNRSRSWADEWTWRPYVLG